MRCTLCDRCKKIVENERKIKVVTYARPLESKPGVRRSEERRVGKEC